MSADPEAAAGGAFLLKRAFWTWAIGSLAAVPLVAMVGLLAGNHFTDRLHADGIPRAADLTMPEAATTDGKAVAALSRDADVALFVSAERLAALAATAPGAPIGQVGL